MLKSNIYSIFVFVIGLCFAYLISFQLTQKEKQFQHQNLKIESQAIKHNLQIKLQGDAAQILLTINRWRNIDDINQYWLSDTDKLKKINPFIEGIKFFPLTDYKKFKLPSNDIINSELESDRKRQLRNRSHLPLDAEKLNSSHVYSGRMNHTYATQKTFNLQFPVLIESKIVAYVEVSMNIDKLLRHKIDTFQITKPFSLSEDGMTIFSSLPKNMHIDDIFDKFDLTIYDRTWKLTIWSSITPRDKELFLIFTVLISFLAALTVKLLSLYYLMQNNIKEKEEELKRIDDEFKHSEAKLIQSNKLASLGEIAAGVAHEINQPLQVICIHTEMCQNNLLHENYHLVEKSFKAIVNQVDRIEKIVKQVGSFGRDTELDNYKEEKTSSIFDNVMAIIINQYKQDGVELRQVIPPSLPALFCNKIQIEQVLINLLINAKDSVETSRNKIVFMKAHVQKNNLYIQISDTGCGIDPTKINEIFTPFYTTKPLGKGTGLGLSISYSIIHQHKGDIKVTSEIGKGTVFTVRLPLL
ncbi:GHKL domain-containing protein [Psychromonas sp. RZ5]|nr:GHKL domain-containing protein [Psychromonas sp. RZ5]